MPKNKGKYGCHCRGTCPTNFYVPAMPTTFIDSRGQDWPSRRKGLRVMWLYDWSILLVLGALIVGLRFVSAPTHWFRLDDPSLAYPDVPETFSAVASMIISVAIPLFFIAISQIWIRDARHFYHAIVALAQSILLAFVFVSLLWATVGGLRPRFYADCKPDLSKRVEGQIYYNISICTALSGGANNFVGATPTEGFPSGHAANAIGATLFAVIYLNAVLKTFDGFVHFWKLLLCVCIMFFGVYVSLTRWLDFRHDPWQLFWGMVIGAVATLISYRLHFASVWGPDSHIPYHVLWQQYYDNKGKTLNEPRNPHDPTSDNANSVAMNNV
jgi:hypothetical protein